ncbi:hypothetical protein [Williamsoniiplasma lucivorax]|uniref:Uncharacterized protein n=1 Tax=Williamsoniiplasma lucivorax TaxID=209274 RepID=A0A2S5RE38_9MOLU|nr:hypothetical protein [Williamsoniiplasma lucivorax]PPE05395.1 hypothetical protein ELUCI_v1c04870 [Williamsoniiplasma lucivorax]
MKPTKLKYKKQEKRTRFWVDFYNIEDIEILNLFKATIKESSTPKQPAQAYFRLIFLQAITNYLKDGKLLDNFENALESTLDSRNREIKLNVALNSKKAILDSERRLAKIEANLILLTNLLAKQFNFQDKIEMPKDLDLEPFTFLHQLDREMKSHQRNQLANYKKKDFDKDGE